MLPTMKCSHGALATAKERACCKKKETDVKIREVAESFKLFLGSKAHFIMIQAALSFRFQ